MPSNSDYQQPRQGSISARYQRDGTEIFIGRLRPRPNPVGEPSGSIVRPIVSAVTAAGAIQSCSDFSGYQNLAMMSIDGLLRPVSLAGEGSLPRFGTKTDGSYNSYSPPIFVKDAGGAYVPLSGSAGVEQRDLNPIKNPSGVAGITDFIDHRSVASQGHDYELLAQRTGLTRSQSLVTCIGEGSGVNHKGTYSNDYRFLALKAPLVLTGPGYDLEGKPIPNSADTVGSASQGVFATDNLTDKFLPNYLQQSKTWPVGPLDLRWDRKRGVWVAPQYRLVLGRALGPIASGQAGILQLEDATYVDNNGNPTTGYITGVDKLGIGLSGGKLAYAYYNPSANEYWILGGSAGSGGGGGSSSFSISQFFCTGYGFTGSGTTGTGVGGVPLSGALSGHLYSSTPPSGVTRLVISTGLTLTQTGTSGFILTSNFSIFQKGGCFGTGSGVGDFSSSGESLATGQSISAIRIGRGLRIGRPAQECLNIINLDTNLSATIDTNCVGSGGGPAMEFSRRKWNRLMLADGLAGDYYDDCTLRVGLSMTVGNAENVSSITPGCGLFAYDGGGCSAVLRLNFPFNSATGFAGFETDQSLRIGEGSFGGCRTVSFGLHTGGRQSPPILTNILCISGDIYGEYIRLQFNPWGQYTGYLTGIA